MKIIHIFNVLRIPNNILCEAIIYPSEEILNFGELLWDKSGEGFQVVGYTEEESAYGWKKEDENSVGIILSSEKQCMVYEPFLTDSAHVLEKYNRVCECIPQAKELIDEWDVDKFIETIDDFVVDDIIGHDDEPSEIGYEFETIADSVVEYYKIM